jgi:phosphatidylglycerophosphate synthase
MYRRGVDNAGVIGQISGGRFGTGVWPTSLQRQSGMNNTKEIKRTIEIEEFSNRFLIHPISGWLVPLFHRHDVHPNTVSLGGALSGALAALCYYHYDSTAAVVAGFLFMLGWHVLDGADGQLARLSGKVTASGYVIDGICDYTTFILVYVALASRLAWAHGTWVWFIVVLAGLSHIAQAAAFELQRESYNKWVSGKAFDSDLARDKAASSLRGIAYVYTLVQRPFRPLTEDVERRLRAFPRPDGPSRQEAAQSYRTHFRTAVLRWSWLSANNHTAAIFIACLLGKPMLYFLFEIFVLNGALVLLVRMNQARAERFAGWLAVNGA